jgi:DNA-binding SARP family transcriptional activator
LEGLPCGPVNGLPADAANASVSVAVLGVTEACDATGAPIDVGTPKQRALLAALALQRGRPVSVGALEEILWGEEPPAAVAASLQAYVSGLRKALEPDRPPRTPARVVVTAVPGYALRIPADALDAERYITTVTDVHRGLAPDSGFDGSVLAPSDEATLGRHRAALEKGLALWRGEPYADLGDAPAAVAERARLDDLRLVALLDLASIRLAQGEHAALAGELAPLRHEFPLHEGVALRQVLAEYRCGRQADALATLRAVRDELSETLGVDPGPALQALELAVLRQDPALDWHPPSAATVTAEPARAEPPPTPAVPTDAGALQTGDPRLWPVVGRESELAALNTQLDAASSGHTGFALLVGEPGIGKTRLVEEVMARARARGFVTMGGRCSEDEGAPPLWPWRSILTSLHAQLPADFWSEVVAPYAAHLADLLPPEALTDLAPLPDVSGEGQAEQRFRVWDAVSALLASVAVRQPVLVVLDDLHWADTSSLRLLRHLAQSVPETALLVVGTRRPNPEPEGALAEVGEAVARRHGLRMDLVGLDAADVVQLVEAAGGQTPTAERAEQLRARTDGNPFFVVELVRWQGSGTAGQEVPTLVSDVVARRIDQLPSATRQVIRSAAVLGRTFDLDVLAQLRDEDEDEVLDELDPALAAGIVFESRTQVGQFRFAHALVQEAVYHGMSAVRRARRHAEAAQVLADHPAEAAHHWLAAGPSHAGNAWRAASVAAEEARRVFGHEEVSRLLGAALQAQRDDPTATPAERYELLMRRSDACRWAADIRGLDACLAEAIDVARSMGDYERMARAAVGTTEGSLWSTRDYGVVDDGLVSALEAVLHELPAGDSELRCRAMLSLASELFYTDQTERLEALTDEGLAMARRLGDPPLRLWGLQTAFVARWRSRLAEQRRSLAEEAVELAVALGDETAEAMVRSLRAAAAQELGDVETMRTDIARVRAIAGPRRLAFPLLLLGWMEVPWLSMAGDFDAAEELFAKTLVINETTTVRQRPEVVFGALLSMRYWQGRTDELLPMMDAMADSPMKVIGLTKVFLLVQGGRVADARAVASERGVDLATFPVSDDWLTVVTLYQLSRIAVAFEDRDACARFYGLMSPFSGRVVSAGSAAALGSVDAVLGLLASVSGEHELAGRHADRARGQLTAWGVPLALAELEAWRERYGF